MALAKVCVSDNVLQNCLVHAYTTEREEVMGLLMGEIIESTGATGTAPSTSSSSGGKVAWVWGAHVVQRNVRRDDRVEIAPEALYTATEVADALGESLGRPTRVIGWYHSHPRITPYPSHVDLQSQAMYQQMESGWVGLIFSVFHTDSSELSTCMMHCFRTGPGNTHEKIPVEVVRSSALPLHNLPLPITTHEMLRTFKEEIEDAVRNVEIRCNYDENLVAVVQGVGNMQLFTLDRLITQPMIKHLKWTAIPQLEAEVARLKKQLESMS